MVEAKRDTCALKNVPPDRANHRTPLVAALLSLCVRSECGADFASPSERYKAGECESFGPLVPKCLRRLNTVCAYRENARCVAGGQ